MTTKAIIENYSEALQQDSVKLMANDDLLASATGEKIEIKTHQFRNTSRFMVTICDNDGIAHSFFHVDIVEDLRKLPVRMG